MSSKISLYKFPHLWSGCVSAYSPAVDQIKLVTSLYDQSGRQNHATLNGGMVTSNYVPSSGRLALNLNGIYDPVQLPSPFAASSFPTLSMTCWALLRSASRSGIMGNRDAALVGFGVSANRTTAGNISLVAGGMVLGEVQANIALNRWTHFCVTATRDVLSGDQLNYTVYVNGVVFIAVSNSTKANASTLFFGADTINTNFGNIQIDDMFVYNRALSVSETMLHANRRGIAYETNAPRLPRFSIPSSSVSGTASGTLPLTGGSVGVALVKGSASGNLALTGSAVGNAISGRTGTATGSISLTGSSTATIRVQGNASGSLALSGSASGAVFIQGTASGSLPLTGSTNGITNNGRTGSAEGSISLSGSSTGKVVINTTASGNLSLSGNATGSVLIRGSGSGNISISGIAVIGDPYTVYVSPIDLDFIQMAEELFADFVPEANATYKYINADNTANPATPWDVTFGTSIEYQVKLIVYPSEIEGRRTSKYRDGTEVPTGAIKVLMKKESFEPKQKDFVQLRGKLYKVLSIDPIAPLYQSICHILTLGL